MASLYSLSKYSLILLSLFTTSCHKLDDRYKMMNPDSNHPSPASLRSSICNLRFPKGNLFLHNFVLNSPCNHDQAYEANIRLMLAAMRDHASVNTLNDQGNSPLHLAVLQNNIVMVQQLLSNFSNINVNIPDRNGNTALSVAAREGYLEIVKFLVGKGAYIDAQGSPGRTPLHEAMWNLNSEVTDFLIEKGADVNGLNEYDGDTALIVAAKEGRLEVVKFLVRKGARVDVRGRSGRNPFQTALLYNGGFKIADFLIEKGADIDGLGEHEETALLEATTSCYLDVTKYLIEKGAKANIGNRDGETPLMLAVRWRDKDLDVVDMLIQKLDADVHVLNEYGETLLHEVIRNMEDSKDLRIAALFIQRGVDVNAKDANNCTSLHCAVEADNLEAIVFLLDQGAKPEMVPRRVFKAFLRKWLNTDAHTSNGTEMCLRIIRKWFTPEVMRLYGC